MFHRIVCATLMCAVVSAANADISLHVESRYEGFLSDETTYVYSYDLMVEVTGDDRWQTAGGLHVGVPWITLEGGSFYQHPLCDTNPANPDLFAEFPDSEYTSFYTTPASYPDIAEMGDSPSFAYGPADTPEALCADWFRTPEPPPYQPGDFTIARFSIVPDNGEWSAVIDMQAGSLEGMVPFYYAMPEPGSLSLLALGALVSLRRR